jgi:MoaA/NifB/PqqE/SkfB family radical SAM enzyme
MVMKLEDIGFYTLSDERAATASVFTPNHRCELILTNQCNLHCTYCRGLPKAVNYVLPYEEVIKTINLWLRQGLVNIRFSGGEPTLYNRILDLVKYCHTVSRIAISTNGMASKDFYNQLIDAGVNDFSVSLDSCCASEFNTCVGSQCFDRVVEMVKYLATQTYTTIGCVVTEATLLNLEASIKFFDTLGVDDIRIIPSAQYNQMLNLDIPENLLNKYPILRYRYYNMKHGRHVRGLTAQDSHRCSLAFDDMAIAGEYHYPRIIYLREQGQPIGKVGKHMREERYNWAIQHDTHCDPICKQNCLDVCIDYNNRYKQYH